MAGTNKTIGSATQFKTTTLPSGVKVMSELLPGVRSISLGIWVNVGSRNERSAQNGLSHFIEHLVFKGTGRRNARQIAASLENIGGSLNAFTSKEHTCFVARVLDSHLDDAVDVLADLTSRPTFTAANIRLEKGVVCEEIKEAHDTPSDRIHDNFASAFWKDHSLGQTILGEQDTILSMTRKRIVDFYKHHYRAESIVVAAAGSVSHRKLVKLVKDKLNLPDGKNGPYELPVYSDQKTVAIERTNGLQTHLCLGFPGLPFASPSRAAAMTLHALLGGGMSSILFQKIREQLGLAYSVYTFHDFHYDAGLFGAYLGTDKAHVRQAFDTVLAEMKKLKRRKQSVKRIEEVKAQLKGQFVIGMEGTSNRMSRIARTELMGGQYLTMKETLKKIDQVTPSQVLEMANRLIDEDKMAVSVLGPIDAKSFADVR